MLHTTRATQILLAALVLALLILSFVLMTFANAGTQNFSELSLPVELNTALPGDTGYNVYQLADGSLILNSANQTGTYLTKLDQNNQILWTQKIHIGSEALTRMIVLNEGGFLLAGIVNNLYVLAKTDSEGNV